MGLCIKKGTLPCVILCILFVKCSSALLCYSCRDLTINEDCTNVTVCGDNDVCFTQSDGFDTGAVKHTLGCRNIKAQTTTKVPGRFTFCDHICQEDLCNLKLCTVKSNASRPPRCLSCAFVNKPGDCSNVKLCRENEMCYVNEFTSFGEVRYRMGCIRKQFCEKTHLGSPVVLVGKRSQNQQGACSMCCSTDHCNDFVCANSTRENGEILSLKKLTGYSCKDSAPDICGGFGMLSKDSCRLNVVQKACGKSCETCDHISWSNWQPWGSCTKSCGSDGTQTRQRGCEFKLDELHGVQCVYTTSETRECNRKHCPVNGQWCRKSVQSCSVGSSGYGLECTSHNEITCDCPAPAYGGHNCPA